jgi:hypothetical protein
MGERASASRKRFRLFGGCGPNRGRSGPLAAVSPGPEVTSQWYRRSRYCGSHRLFYLLHARPHAALGRALSLASQLPPRPLQPSMSAWLRKQLVGATVFSTCYMRPHAALGRALSLASQLPHRSLQHQIEASLRKQLVGATVFSTCYIHARPHAAPGRVLSLASQLPPRPLQPSMSAWLRKQLVGATVFSTPYMPDRMQRLAGPYRWQVSSHPDLRSRQCRHGCASSLWERACPR